MVSLESVFGDEASILHEKNYQLLLLANILGPLGTALISPILDSLIEPFGASPGNIGLMVSAFVAPAIVGIPAAGILADRVGRKPVLITGLVLFGCAGAAIALTTDFRIALLLRVIQGIGAVGLIPIIVTSIGDLYTGDREATAQGLRFTGSGLTQASFPLVSGVLVVVAWQYPFYMYLVALPVALAIYVWFEETTTNSPDPHTDSHRSTWTQLADLRDLLAQRRVYMMLLARSLPEIVWLGFLTYNSIVIVRLLDGTPAQAGIVVMVASLSYATAASQAGRITAMAASRFRPLLAANVALGVGFSVFVLAPTVLVSGLGIAIAGMGLGITMTLYRSIITGFATESVRGSLVSVAEGLGRVMATITPIFIGGIIAIGTTLVGFSLAVQLAGLGAAVIGGFGGVACLAVVHRSPPVTYDSTDTNDD